MVIGHHHTTKQIVEKKTINKKIEDTFKKKLSIQFSLDGFSFCACNSNNEVYNFSSYQFLEAINSPELILNKIQQVFENEKSLQEDFETVTVIHQNNLNSLVPNEYFNESSLKNYLKYSIRTISTDLIVYDTLDFMESKNVYIPYVNINNFLFQNFGEFEYRHHSSILLEKLFLKNTESEVNFFVHVSKSIFDIVVFKKSKLLFYNIFDYETKEDFIYYILFTLEQLELDPEDTMVTLIGAIDSSSDNYKILYNYVRNINFLNSQNTIFNSQDTFTKHSNFILLG